MNGEALPLRARRIHIAGSADPETDSARLTAIDAMVQHSTWQLLEGGASFVSAIGREPRSKAGVPLVFYWASLEEIVRWARAHEDLARERQPLVKIVATEKARGEIPPERGVLWAELLERSLVAFESLPPGWGSAALVRTRQANYGNVLPPRRATRHRLALRRE